MKIFHLRITGEVWQFVCINVQGVGVLPECVAGLFIYISAIITQTMKTQKLSVSQVFPISTANQNAAQFTHSHEYFPIALRNFFHGFIGVAGQRERHSTNLHDIWDMLKPIDFEFVFKNRKFHMLTRYNTFCVITRKLFYKQAPKKILRYNIGGFRTS